MPATLIKNILRMIRATKGRFFSLTAIVAIGVAFFVGVSASSPIMGYSVDRYNDEMSLKDFTIYSNYGFDEEDIRKIRDTDGVAAAEGAWFADVLAVYQTDTIVTRVHSYDQNGTINRVSLREGRYPENEYEALAEAGTTLSPGFPIGTVIHFTYPEGTTNDSLLIDHVTITGTVDTPLYLDQTKENSTLSNQYITTYLYVLPEAFDQEYFLEVNVLMEGGKELYSFADEYADLRDEMTEQLEDTADVQQNARFLSIKAEAEEAYQDGLREYEDGKAEFEDKITEGEQELADGEQEIKDGETQLNDAEQELQNGISELASETAMAEQQLADAQRELNEAAEQLRQKEAEFTSMKTDLLRQKEELAAAEQQLQEAADGLAQIDDGLAQLQQAKDTLESEELTTLMEVIRLLPEDTSVEELISLFTEAQQVIAQAESNTEETILPDFDNVIAVVSADADSYYASLHTAETEETVAYLRTLDPSVSLDEVDDEGTAALRRKLSEDFGAELNTAGELLRAYEAADRILMIAQERVEEPEEIEAFLRALTESELLDEIESIEEDEIRQMIAMLEEVSGVSPITTTAELAEAYDAAVKTVNGQIDELQTLRKEITGALQEKGIEESGIADAITQIEDGMRQIDEGIEDGERQIADGWNQIAAAQQQINDGYAELREKTLSAQREIDNGAAQIAVNRQKLADAVNTLQEGKAALEKARNEGLEELEKVWAELQDARDQIDSLEEGKWTVLNRKSHYASVTYAGTIDQMKAIGNIFPVFFILVAALVCLTTMTRMVDESRGEIGTLRALGYTHMHCAGKYLCYAGAATLIGEIIGVVVGMLTFPIIIYNTWKLMYILPPISIVIPWNLIALSGICFMAGMLAATWYSCISDMREVPAQLMRPKAPKIGRKALIERIGMIWNRMSFSWKVTTRNIFRYRKRFVMTVLGVAGCTALLVTGLGIRDSINAMVDLQFKEIYKYDGVINLKKNLSEEEVRQLYEQIAARDDVAEANMVMRYTALASGNNDLEETVYVQLFEDAEAVKKTYDLRQRVGHEEIILPEDGIVLTEKLTERLGIRKGDVIHIEGENGAVMDIPVSDITEFYVRHYGFMTESAYESFFHEIPAPRSVYVRVNGDQEANQALQQEMMNIDGVDSIEFYDAALKNFDSMVKGLDIIMWAIIVSSMLLAFVVLGNLINVNISERQREIATLKVLGFYPKEVRSYIYKENNVLTIIGALCGLPVGTVLHHYIMQTVEVNMVMFGRDVLPLSYVYAFVMTLVFGILVDRSMAKRLRNIEMVESLKSVE